MIYKYSISELGKIFKNPETGYIQINPKAKKFEVLADYLNGINTIELINKEEHILKRIVEVLEFGSFEKRWNCLESELGGNMLKNPNYGWVTLKNYHPNILVNTETKQLYLAYLLDSKLNLNHETDIAYLKNLLREWREIISGSLNKKED